MKKEKNTALGASEHDDGSYVVKKSKKSSIFAFVICVFVAFIIWAYAEATEKKDEEKQTVVEVLSADVVALDNTSAI